MSVARADLSAGDISRVLLDVYGKDGLRTIVDFGLDLARVAWLIVSTRRWGGAVSRLTLCLPRWIELFRCDSDAAFVIGMVAYGVDFDTDDTSAVPFFRVDNYVADDHRERVDAQIRHEVAEGRIVPALPGIVGISAVGSVLKGGTDKVRVIHDYSRPGGGVNASVRARKETFSRVADAASLLRPGAYHCKVDISEAYRAFPMAPMWWTRHAFEWGGVVYSDLRLPFGSSGAPSAFHPFSAAFTRAVKARGFGGVVSYLDDFWLTA